MTGSLLKLLPFFAVCVLMGCKTPAEQPEEPPTESTPPVATSQPAQTTAAAAMPEPVCDPDDDGCRAQLLGPVDLGWLSEETQLSEVTQKLGEPGSKTERFLEEATGHFVEDWVWQGPGVSLTLGAPDMKAPVDQILSVTVRAPFDQKTAEGIGIGSSEEDVIKAYGHVRDPLSRPGELFIAGSVYGGAFFTIEQGKVVGIFLGAGAE